MYSCIIAESLYKEQKKHEKLYKKINQVKYENYINKQTKDFKPCTVGISDIHYQMTELKVKIAGR